LTPAITLLFLGKRQEWSDKINCNALEEEGGRQISARIGKLILSNTTYRKGELFEKEK